MVEISSFQCLVAKPQALLPFHLNISSSQCYNRQLTSFECMNKRSIGNKRVEAIILKQDAINYQIKPPKGLKTNVTHLSMFSTLRKFEIYYHMQALNKNAQCH